jgi:spoIIIJ-associated protein
MDGQAAQSAQLASGAAQPLEAYLAPIDSLLKQIIQHGRFALAFTIRRMDSAGEDREEPEFVVDFSGQDVALLLERNGELLNALEYLVLKAVRLGEDHFRKIVLDCEDWRRLRAEELKLMAQVAADRVVETGNSFSLAAMSPRERRVIHLALRERPDVRSESEGFGAERKVVIFPANSPGCGR